MKPASLGLAKKKLVTWEQRVELLKGEQHITVETPRPLISMITINRPECGNMMSHRTRAQLFNQLQLNDQDPDIRVTIIRGAGGTFSAGNDFDTNRQEVLPMFEAEVDGQTSRHVLNGWLMLNDLAKPVVAMVEGECIGAGLELAAACDVCVCAEDAKIGYAPVRGQSLGDYQILPWLCGMRNAMELILTNQPMTGIEAAKRNFVTEAVPRSELEERTFNLAERIAKIPSDLLAFNKKSVHRAFEEMGMRTYLRYAVDLETLMLKAPGAKMLNARRPAASRAPGAARAPVPRPHANPSAPSAMAAQMVSAKSDEDKPAASVATKPAASPAASVATKPAASAATKPAVSAPAKATGLALASAKPSAPKAMPKTAAVPKAKVAASAEDVADEPNERDEDAPARAPAASKSPGPIKTAPRPAPSTPSKAPAAATKAATPAAKATAATKPTTPPKSTVAATPKSTTPARTGTTDGSDVQIHLHEAVHIHINGSPKTPSKL